jgi:hypothetical protein
MILIVASIADCEATAFAGDCGGAASVLTCNDLIRRPARLHHPNFLDSTITTSQGTVGMGEIKAVLNLLPAVMPNELTAYAPEERTYQAAEMRALLVFFLSQLPCPVINRPTPLHVNGGVQNPPAWLAMAHRAGIPAARLEAGCRNAPPIEVVSLGGRLVKHSGTAADRYTRELAHRCHVDYLRATYQEVDSEIRFVGGDSYPDIHNPLTRAALRKHLLELAA